MIALQMWHTKMCQGVIYIAADIHISATAPSIPLHTQRYGIPEYQPTHLSRDEQNHPVEKQV